MHSGDDEEQGEQRGMMTAAGKPQQTAAIHDEGGHILKLLNVKMSENSPDCSETKLLKSGHTVLRSIVFLLQLRRAAAGGSRSIVRAAGSKLCVLLPSLARFRVTYADACVICRGHVGVPPRLSNLEHKWGGGEVRPRQASN